jgi:hypothetical protein
MSVESLENRYAPAGNVLATMVGGNLMIRGDGEDNGLQLTFKADGTVEVAGVDAGGEATMINGSAEPFVASNVRFVTRVHLGAGDDSLEVESEALANATAQGPQPLGRAGRLQALRSELSDRLSGDLFSRQRLLINVGQGTDTVDATVRNDLAVHMAGNSADDAVTLETLADIAAELAGDANASLDVDADGNPDGLANLSVDEAATAALIGASTANLTPNAVDAAFADLSAQAQANANANLNAQAGLLSNVGMNDSLGNGALNSNIGAGVSGAFQSQVGTLPLG